MKTFIFFLFVSFCSLNAMSQNVELKNLTSNSDGVFVKDGTTYNGKFYIKNSNGGIGVYGNIKDGKWDGTVTWLYSDGKKKRESKYVLGNKEGLTYYWFSNGQMKAEIMYREDKNIDQRLWYDDGRERKASFNQFN